MPSSRQHIETVMNVVSGAIAVPAEAEEHLIHRSWIRCYRDYGLDPASRHAARIEPSPRLRERRARHERYLQVARAGMEQLYRHVSDLGYVLLLADADGITLDCVGDDSAQSPLSAGLVLGADWNELHAGTNGIGTCLAERRTLTCHRDDHYYAGNLGLSCTATPLFDPHGELMGVLDVSSLSSPEARESQHLARHLTALYGRMIEDANFMQRFRERWILRLGTVGALIDVNAELMLAFDADGVIVGANSGARRRLGLFDSTLTGDLIGHSLSAVFRDRVAEIWRLARGADAAERGLLHTWAGEGYHATVLAPRAAARPAAVVDAPAPAAAAAPAPTLQTLAGDDPRMETLIERARRLVARPLNILIQGETGTGKEVLAKALHEASPRAAKPFVAVNCAAIPESLIESELFGYKPGTFTGARSRGMVGLIQRADGGTLFLDEIGDMPLALQTRLLRVLSEGEVLPLGADKPVPLQLVVFAASHRDLQARIAAGEFREDLYYRLSGAVLPLPPLRERQDRAYLIRALLRDEAERLDASAAITPAALDCLLRHPWPGNIRQLRNALRYALSMADADGIDVEHLPPEVVDASQASGIAPPTAPVAAPAAAADAVPRSERAQLLDALRRHHWVITKVARELRLCRATVYRQMKRHGIVSPTQLH
ncbi:sigma-54-dependent Fis family transcriptional regulator [Solimonas flava]|uniref:sigma-54-dependent Fis family transcriptional regulator n=1 Tax=Solimonas flava TaxID=415849 RepID=UPI0003F4D1E9|nr:sigma-54-dependent Fis family transcriptional regulator [Solimonas flava]